MFFKLIQYKLSIRNICISIFLLFSSSLYADEFISKIPTSLDHSLEKAELGKKLFLDARLSSDGSVSCASCHSLENYGVDGKNKSIGVAKLLGKRNAPTVYNAALNFTQFWDGRAANLHEQAPMPLLTDVEMGLSNIDEAIETLRSIPEYKAAFTQIYSGDISLETISDAIAEFGKTLLAPNSPFDKFLDGDKDAISERAKSGYDKFVAYGCISCHQGANVGGNMFQKFGVHDDISLRGASDDDLGRYLVTRNAWDKRVFKVPSLRLAVHTAPYFHDGSVETIEEAIDIMIRFQLGRDVPESDRDDIVEFLKTLPGNLQGQ